MQVLRLFAAVILAVALIVPSMAATDGEPGLYVVRITDASCGCPRDGGMVYFDGVYMGNITGGKLEVEFYEGDTPYSEIMIVRKMYETYQGPIEEHPAPGDTVVLSIPLEPETNEDSTGYYRIICPVDGADVLVDNVYAGSISGGELVIPVPSGDWTSIDISVIKPGYSACNLTLTARPASGGTLQVCAPIEQETTQAGSLFPATSAVLAFFAALLVIRRQ